VASLVLVAFLVLAAAPHLIAPHDPQLTRLTQRVRPPAWETGGSSANLFGTDPLGRDILSRIVYGARISMTIAALALLASGAIGLLAGLTAGYAGGLVDGMIMRVADAALSIPLFLVAMVLAVTRGPGELNVVMVVGALLWAQYARVLRGEVLSLRGQEYVAAARALGASGARVVWRHLLPNVLPTFLVLLTTQVGSVVLIEAALSFLGAGVPPPAPAWGTLVADGRDVAGTAWWVSFFPGLAIVLVVASLNFIGDWLRDVLDPRLRLG
jgi:peptide/nickel transport system permease protein